MTTVRSHTRRGLVALLAASMMLAACGDDDNANVSTGDPTTDTSDTTTAASDGTGGAGESSMTTGSGSGEVENVDRDASLVYASCCVAQVFDPHNQVGGGINGWYSLYDRLTYIGTPEDPNADGVSLMLAESWEYSDDGRQLTLSLREDVTFNDGTSVTADAVKASLERAQASQYSAAEQLAMVETIEAIDDHTVLLVLSEPNGALLANLAGPAGAVMNPAVFNDPSVDLDLAPPAAAGSGPFALESFEPLTRMVFVLADDDYWDPEATYLARLEVLAEPDTTTRLNGLQSGEYDLVGLFSRFIPEGQRLAETDGFQIHVLDGRSNSVLFLNRSTPELSDVRVRQAIAMAVDRPGIAEGTLHSTCTVNDQLWSPGILGYNPDFENPYPYDLDAARSLLADAGAEGLELELTYPSGATQETIATAFQAALAEIGITATLTGIPPTDLLTDYLDGARYGTFTAIAAQADADAIATNQLATYTFGGDDERFASLLEEARTTVDPEARNSLYSEMNDYLIEDVWAVPFCNAQFAWVGSDQVINIDRMPYGWSAVPDTRYLGILAD